MYNLQKNQVGFYKSMKSTQVYEVTLEAILNGIRDGRWADQVLKYRENGDTSIKGSLPCFTVGGIFSPTKSAENIKSFSGLLSLDLDNTTIPQEQVRAYVEDGIGDHLVAFFRSTGGKGYCALVSVKNVESSYQFKRVYQAIYERVKPELDVTIKFDHLPNINRLRYVSYDPMLCIYPSPIPFEGEAAIENTVTLPLPKSEKNVAVTFGSISDDEKLKIVLEKYEDYAGKFGEKGTRHDWTLGLARWACRADIDEGFLVSYCLTNFNNPSRPDVWRSEVARCIRDSYRSYGAERGSVAIEKKFSFDGILKASNVEQVREQLIWYIADKTNYKKSLEGNGKSSTFVEKEIKFLTKILNYL